MIEFTMIVSFISLAIGLTLCLVGIVFAIAFLLTNDKQKGIISIFIPFLAIVFCFSHHEKAKHPLRLFFYGLILVILSTPVFTVFSDKYNKSIISRATTSIVETPLLLYGYTPLQVWHCKALDTSHVMGILT